MRRLLETTDPSEGKAERQLHWTRAVATEDPDMLEALGEIIERYLLTGKLEISNPAKYTGRGKKREPVMWTNAAKQDGRGATCRETRRRLQKIRPGRSDENHKAIRRSDGAVSRSDETLEKITETRSDDGIRNTTDGGASDTATTSETGASDRKQEAPNRSFPVDDQERRAIEDCSDGKGRWKLDGQLLRDG